MKIIALMENDAGKNAVLCEHGLSVYIETEKHKLLVDTGASPQTWINAKTLGVKPEDIDLVFLSHGHYDHAGGILSLTEMNSKAPIYLHEKAGLDYYGTAGEEPNYIGIDKRILGLDRCVFLDGEPKVIDEELSAFGNVSGRRSWPQSNLSLRKKEGDSFIQDPFDHEQYLVVRSGGKSVLISGCAHNGILNILDKYKEIYASEPDVVISGFHMMKKSEYNDGEIELIKDVAEELSGMHTVFYTGHCTGGKAFGIMKEIMGDQLQYFHSGDCIADL